MEEDSRVKSGDITPGEKLPWPMFDSEGRLLLKKGTVVADIDQVNKLISRGLYRKQKIKKPSAGTETEKLKKSNDATSPFIAIDELISHLSDVFTSLLAGKENTENSILRLCAHIQLLCKIDADAMIGSVHLQHARKYTLRHPVHVAILSELVGARMGLSTQVRASVLAAGLTANLSMIDLQEDLYYQETAPTSEQMLVIRNHPDESVRVLEKMGIRDKLWLEIIKQHHESVNSNGYPEALKDDQICKEAQLMSIADRYSALVSARGYRDPRISGDTLKEFFMKKCEYCCEEMTLFFIKEMSIWPPGSIVLLANGEVAIVTKRSSQSMWPIVRSIIGPGGSPYAQPYKRDTSLEEYRIKSNMRLRRDMPLNLSRIWGYS